MSYWCVLCVCICVPVCVCALMYADVCICLHVCAFEAKGQWQMSSSVAIYFILWVSFSVNLEFTGLPRQSGWQALTIHPSLFPQHWGYRHVSLHSHIFWCEFWVLNSDRHACLTRTLVAKSSSIMIYAFLWLIKKKEILLRFCENTRWNHFSLGNGRMGSLNCKAKKIKSQSLVWFLTGAC